MDAAEILEPVNCLEIEIEFVLLVRVHFREEALGILRAESAFVEGVWPVDISKVGQLFVGLLDNYVFPFLRARLGCPWHHLFSEALQVDWRLVAQEERRTIRLDAREYLHVLHMDVLTSSILHWRVSEVRGDRVNEGSIRERVRGRRGDMVNVEATSPLELGHRSENCIHHHVRGNNIEAALGVTTETINLTLAVRDDNGIAHPNALNPPPDRFPPRALDY